MIHNVSKRLCLLILIQAITSPMLFAETLVTKFAYVGDRGHSAYLGAEQGLEEANLQGEFMNHKYMIDVYSAEDALSADFSPYIAILTATDADKYRKIADKNTSTSVFNLNLSDDALRLECRHNALHIFPSDSMLNDALKQMHKKNPDSNAVAQAWHADFVKFAARDLNKRYKATHEEAMDDYGYSGWAAVKMTSDSVARTQISTAPELLEFLRTKLKFDGQKGEDMKFRETGQMEQLILLVENNEIIAEAPIRGIAKPPTLDSLGILNCPK